jgi:DNA-binding CsgD family transcriptional regulator
MTSKICIIQKLYTCHNLDTFPIDALKVVDRLVPSDWPLFVLTNTRTGQLFQTSLPSFSVLSPGLIEVLEKILSEDRENHPIARNMPQTDYLGAIVLSTEGRVISIAPQAIIWLETYFTKSSYFARLPDLLWSWVKHQVNGLVHKSDLAKVCKPLHVDQNGRELTIRLVIESNSRYLLLLEEQRLASFNSLELLGLSQRETEVLHWLIQGKDNKHIAVQLSIKVGTVRKHLENIYLKLGVQSRTEAVAYALDKLGLLDARSLIQ